MAGEAEIFKEQQRHPGHPRGMLGPWRVALGVALGSAILGQAMIYHQAAPFVVIFSVLVWRRRRTWFVPFMVGGLVGTGFGVGWLPMLVLLGWAFLVPLPWYRPGWAFMQWPVLALGAAAVFGLGQVWTLYTLTIVAAITTGSVLLVWLLSSELTRLLEGDLDRRTLVLVLTALACLIAGLAGYQIERVNPSLLIGGLVMLLAAVFEGAAGGAVAGATLGVTLALRGSGSDLVGILVAGGFLAGWFRTWHWRLGSLGLVLGFFIYAVFIRLPQPLEPFWLSLTAAAAIFQLVPDALVRIGQTWVQSFSSPTTEDAIRERMGHIAGVMKEMARAFQVDDEINSPEAEWVQSIIEDVCKKCSLYRLCWETDFYRSYRGVLDLSVKAHDLLVTEESLSGDLARRCIRPDEVAHAANVAVNRERERATYVLAMRESRRLAELQLTGLADLVEDMARGLVEDMPRRPRWKLSPVEPLPYRVGVAKRPRRGGTVSGDTELIADLSRTQAVFGLSDGMGVGPRAAWESGTAMSLMEQLLRAGFSQALCVRAVNTTLLLRSVDDHFATLDLLLLDRVACSMEVVKIAASPTFVRRRGQVFAIRSRSLPVGIVKEVSIDPVTSAVEPGDVVVMVTDGVMEAGEQSAEERMTRILLELSPQDPTMMAETILSYMLQDSGDGRDDALVMVILMGMNDHKKTQEKAQDSLVREWQRLTPLSLRG